MNPDPDFLSIIGAENIGRDGEPTDAGYERLIDAIEAGRITVPPEVFKSALAVRAEANRIRSIMRSGNN